MKKGDTRFLNRRLLNMVRRRGFALVITLAALVFVTVLVLAFFSRATLNRQIAFSSTNMAKSDYLARMSLDFITSELRQEILDGSTNLNGGDPTYPAVYQPLSSTNAWPAKTGVNNPDATGTNTIAKVSASSLPLRLSGTVTASSVSITDSSANHRYLSTNRWFGSGGPSLGSQATPPAWFFVTRDNQIKTPAVAAAKDRGNPDYVIGRFACTVYDTSGLLDANVAGYPAAAATNAVYKSFAAYADLTILDTNFTTNRVEDFMKWRNGVADTGSATNYANYLDNFAAPRGFLEAKEGQNAFLSRKDLLNAMNSGLLTTNTVSALTHFSRAISAPSWGPDANSANVTNFVSGAGTPIAYKDNANETASTNRFIPNVRFPVAANIVHYRDDGTIEPYSALDSSHSYKVLPGDPLIQNRFSLAKLEWLTHSGPKSGISTQAIEDCFGLRWNEPKWRWDYVAAKSPGVAIKTLDQVASENREPNFFELLGAGILSGSLGRDPGPAYDWSTDSPGVYGKYDSPGSNYKSEPNLHILQIGANIIDQFDGDSYPTAVYLNVFGNGAPIDDLFLNTLYGTESLPGIYGVTNIALADPVPALGDASGTLKVWVQLELWNPHQYPIAELPDRPTQFRAYVYGNMYPQWDGALPPVESDMGPTMEYDDGTGNGADISSGSIYFTDSGDTTFYNNPKMMTLDLANSTGAVVNTTLTPASNYYQSSYDNADIATYGEPLAQPNHFVGFYVGEAPYPGPEKGSGGINKRAISDPLVTFALQYLGPDNKYHPYNFVARFWDVDIHGDNFHGGARDMPGTTKDEGFSVIRTDPRTDRFSVSGSWWGKAPLPNNTMNKGPGPVAVAGYGAAKKCVPEISSFFYPSSNSAARMIPMWAANNPAFPLLNVNLSLGATLANAYYADPDGVVRLGDSHRMTIEGINTSETGDGCQMYHGDALVTDYAGKPNVKPSLTNIKNTSVQSRRPVILNRPFRSVGELGFAYRDLPFKSLDFWSATSADSALLDLFALADGPPTLAGQISLNRAPQAVMQAILAGGAKSDALNTKISISESQVLSQTIAADTSAKGPYGNRAELASRLGPLVSGTGSLVAFDTTTAATASWANKAYAEAPMRALADIANTRTWNLLVDVVGQVGRVSPNAVDIGSGFVVEGERRYWMHLAIDRYTGKVVSQQLEPVYD